MFRNEQLIHPKPGVDTVDTGKSTEGIKAV